MDSCKNITIGGPANVDKVDAAAPARRPVDEFMLEGINTARVCMYADIGRMATVVDVELF